MIIPIFLAFYSTFSFSQSLENVGMDDAPSSFTFITSRNKEYTLNPINSESYKGLSGRSFFGKVKQDDSVRRWYYVHIKDGYIPEARKHVQINAQDQIIKNTFMLYLLPSELDKISSFSYATLINPSDKIDIISPLTETDYLLVQVSDDYQLPESPTLYTIDRKHNKNSYIIRVDQKGLNSKRSLQKKLSAAQTLSELPGVKLVTPYKNPVEQNNINIGYLQKNDQPLHREPHSGLYKYDRYLHDHNLTGQGEIITIEDSLIDYRHPMFYDENCPLEFNVEMKNHRKFVYYHSDYSYENWTKAINDAEHGTHTAGILAGKSIVPEGETSLSSLFDGSAPDAKMLYVGIYGKVPSEELEKKMKQFGSRISSNSWGDTDIHVESLNQEYGLLAARNPESIFIFSAGNNALYGNFTVGDPGGNKNVLDVAYSNNPVFAQKNTFALQEVNDPSIIVPIEFVAIPFENYIEYSDYLGTVDDKSRFVAVDARNQTCDDLIGPYISVLYGNSSEEVFEFINNCSVTESLGVVLATHLEDVEALIKKKSRVMLIVNTVIETKTKFEKGIYSSFGPATKGIMKPDVMGPGDNVISAMSIKTDNYTCKDIRDGCGLTLKSGTSMAVPNVAGATAIAVQFFKSGRWIDKVELDGTTMRALIINSARHPTGSKSPDFVFGHGFVDFSSVLPLENEFGIQITEQNDKRPSITDDGHLVANIEVKSNKVPLQVTLSYLDVMLNQESPIQLTHDLDLVVVSPDGTIFRGDGLVNDTQHLSTNEKVVIDKDELKVGTYKVHIYAHSFVDNLLSKEAVSQEFSVFATGDIENKYMSFAESDDSACSENDPNHPAFCKCKEDEIGPICQAKVYTYNAEEKILVTVPPMQLYRMKIKADKPLKYISANYSDSRSLPTIWLAKDCHLSLGKYDMNVKVGNNKEESPRVTLFNDTSYTEFCAALFAYSDQDRNYSLFFSTNEYVPPPSKTPSKSPSPSKTRPPTMTPEPTEPEETEPYETKQHETDQHETKQHETDPIETIHSTLETSTKTENTDEATKSDNKLQNTLMIILICLCVVLVGLITAVVVIIIIIKRRTFGNNSKSDTTAAYKESLIGNNY